MFLKVFKSLFVNFTFLLVLSTPALAATINVAPGGSIQAAINSAGPGDTIMVAPGTYSEFLKFTNKHGTASAPIRLVGSSENPFNYPVIDGLNVGYATENDRPVLTLDESSWITIERFHFKNSGLSSILNDGSHYITVRRNIFNYHAYGILLSNKSSHLLIEFNDFSQPYPNSSTWSDLKGSKWEGGAITSFGGAGMHVIRYNYFHHSFNGIYQSNGAGAFIGNFYDANVWIYRNRFEDIVDDPFEPESYAFNNHFFQNTAINTHRLVSLAPQGQGLGPVYVYSNSMSMMVDPTRESSSGRTNSAFKLELANNFYPLGVYLFNNSIDTDYPGTNSYGDDIKLQTVNFLSQKNNVFKTLNPVFSENSLTLQNSELSGDLASRSFGYNEPNSYPNIDPQFQNRGGEDLRLPSTSPARGKSQAISGLTGFAASTIIAAGSDLGAFISGQNDFRTTPAPLYVTPPGGEDPSFPANASWPSDIYPGVNPLSTPKWMAGATPSSPPNPPTSRPGDYDGNNLVNILDFNLIATNFGNPYTLLDYNLIATNFGR